jgi:hypothetical protein
MTTQSTPARSDTSRARLLANRILLVVALIAIVLGVGLGQTFITWLNATLL